jgi:rod shape-determining protein MreC
MYRKRSTGIIGIAVTIILLVILVILSNMNLEKFSNLESIASVLIMPVQNGLTYLKNGLAKNNTFFSDINNLKKENEELREENSKLEKELRELEIIKAENATLKEYMKMSEKYSEYTTVPGYIIDKDISNFSSTLVINIGKAEGIGPNMTVISQDGLVGHVISVTEKTAKVQTIIDPASSLSATISTSRDGIVLRGLLENNKTLKTTYIPTEASLIQGDSVETSGMGGIYEKGIRIGTIKEIVNTKNITDRYAIISTAVDFDKIETVLVIKK